MGEEILVPQQHHTLANRILTYVGFVLFTDECLDAGEETTT
jgi:hypothetical protein